MNYWPIGRCRKVWQQCLICRTYASKNPAKPSESLAQSFPKLHTRHLICQFTKTELAQYQSFAAGSRTKASQKTRWWNSRLESKVFMNVNFSVYRVRLSLDWEIFDGRFLLVIQFMLVIQFILVNSFLSTFMEYITSNEAFAWAVGPFRKRVSDGILYQYHFGWYIHLSVLFASIGRTA